MFIYWLIALVIFLGQCITLVLSYLNQKNMFFCGKNYILIGVIVVNFIFSTMLYFQENYGFFLLSLALEVIYLLIIIVLKVSERKNVN